MASVLESVMRSRRSRTTGENSDLNSLAGLTDQGDAVLLVPYVNIRGNLASLTDNKKKNQNTKKTKKPTKNLKNQAWTMVLFAVTWLLLIYNSPKRSTWNSDFWIISITILQKDMQTEWTPYPPLEQNTSVAET